MIQITKTYPNNHQRVFTITAVSYDEDSDTGIMTTTEDGAVAISAVDTPDIWQTLQQSPFAKETI